MDKNFEYVEDIIGCLKNKYLPLKYAYIKTAADYHTRFAQSENYDFAVVMEQEGYKYIVDYLEEEINYVEIGADDGVKSMKLIELLNDSGKKVNNFHFMDFSEELLEKCRTTMLLHNLQCEFHKCDIENLVIMDSCSRDKATLFVFNGNTLGNMEDEERVLKNIYCMMDERDYFLLGLTLKNDMVSTQQELQVYNNILFKDSVLAFFEYIGINIDSGEFLLSYDENLNSIIGEYEIVDSFVWNNELILKKGDRVRCFQSKRYTLDECKRMFKKVNLQIESYYIDSESRHVSFLLKKNRV